MVYVFLGLIVVVPTLLLGVLFFLLRPNAASERLLLT